MKTPKLQTGILFQQDLHLMVYRPRGILGEKDVETIVAELEHLEDAADQPFYRYTDLSKIDAVDLRFEFIFRISLHRRRVYAKHPPTKSAFLVTSPATTRVARTHAILSDHSPLRVKLFKEIEPAAKWLGVSTEDLDRVS